MLKTVFSLSAFFLFFLFASTAFTAWASGKQNKPGPRYVTFQCMKKALNGGTCHYNFTISNDGSKWEKVRVVDNGCQMDREWAKKDVQNGDYLEGWVIDC